MSPARPNATNLSRLSFPDARFSLEIARRAQPRVVPRLHKLATAHVALLLQDRRPRPDSPGRVAVHGSVLDVRSGVAARSYAASVDRCVATGSGWLVQARHRS